MGRRSREWRVVSRTADEPGHRAARLRARGAGRPGPARPHRDRRRVPPPSRRRRHHPAGRGRRARLGAAHRAGRPHVLRRHPRAGRRSGRSGPSRRVRCTWAGPAPGVATRRARAVVQSLALGALLLGLFMAGAVVVAQVPVLRDPVQELLDHAVYGSLAVVTLITMVNGIAEELYFRGALYAAVGRRHAVAVTTDRLHARHGDVRHPAAGARGRPRRAGRGPPATGDRRHPRARRSPT